MTPADVRAQLIRTLRDDLVGPDDADPRDAPARTERLPAAPSSWYLTGFLAPVAQRVEDKSDETAVEDMDAPAEDAEEGTREAPPARRPVFPSSLGVSVLLRAETRALHVRVTYGTYVPVPASTPPPAPVPDDAPLGPDAMPAPRVHTWVRTPHEHALTLDLDDPETTRSGVALPGSAGVILRYVERPVPESEWMPELRSARTATVFLVNQRVAVARPEHDRGYIFQAALEVACDEDFIPRPNLRGGAAADDIDERIGDLQYRDAYEFAVGHGAAVHATFRGRGRDVFCQQVRTTWLPSADVEKVVPTALDGVELRMDDLAKIETAAALATAVGALPERYRAWIARQRQTELDTAARRDTAAALLHNAGLACERIERGLAALADPDAMTAFRLANRAMAAAARQRSPARYPGKSGTEVPSWRPFQLAFLLMNVAAQLDPRHAERDAVDLIFFPTGGGKTEAYLGLAAFALVLRRLKHPGDAAAGVTVLMRYTLRLLTLDQLERAATLVCALEIERRSDPARLGSRRFAIGLWVGKAATPNRFGTAKDKNESTARNKVLAFNRDPRAYPSPVPLDKCPWCRAPFDQDTFALSPDANAPTQLRIRCNHPRCEFRFARSPAGLPVVAVDDEIYRELPGFLIATVDKFAALPWVGKTAALFGRNVTHADALGFYGAAETSAAGARLLAVPLRPPDLIIQDELHLISGPLGTMVGLYETAIDHLCSRPDGDRVVRPKIVASTATVRRAQPQIRALFARTRVDVFPPPGPDRRDAFFAETVPVTKAHPRTYLGIAAPGRSMKVVLLRTYVALLGAAQRAFARDPAAADPYMTLVGYFNSLRELGGSRRIVEDEVRAKLLRVSQRNRGAGSDPTFADRVIDFECVELTSRVTTDAVKIAKERLDTPFPGVAKGRAPVHVALASNMISVGLDLERLGLMVVCGQPKTTAEYIQATSRVGRDAARPGLVVALLNVHRPRDRSHLEHFEAFHSTFYRAVEATSVTPFSPRAIDRGLAAVTVALARLSEPRLTTPDAAAHVTAARPDLGFVADVLARRAEAHRAGSPGDEPLDELQAKLRRRIASLLDSWSRIADDDPLHEGLGYQRYEEPGGSRRYLLRMPLDPDLDTTCDKHQRRFVANRSLRDVEAATDVFVTTLTRAKIDHENEREEPDHGPS